MEAKLWTLTKTGQEATAIIRTVAGKGFDLRFEWNEEVRQSQVYRGKDELLTAANQKRAELIEQGWRNVPPHCQM